MSANRCPQILHTGLRCWVSVLCLCVSAPLTLTAASVSCQLISRVTGTSVAAQSVQTALRTVTVIRSGALVHLWQMKNLN